MGFEFNLTSFGAGVATGVAGSVAAYRINKAIQNWRESRRYRPRRQSTFRSTEGDGAYNRALVEYAQQAHLMGHRVPLTELLIEPRFIPPIDLVAIPEEDEPINIYETVPRAHDFPFLHAPYNIPTLSIDDLSRSDNLITLVGARGSGRTTALLTIALWSLGEVEFDPPPDAVQEYLAEQEEQLSPEEQAERIKTRVALSEQGRQRYAEMKEDVEEEDLVDPREERISQFRQIAPLYIHLGDIQLQSGEFGRNIDPAEPVIRALQQQVGWYTSKRMVNTQYALLREGGALVLIDGYDDVPQSDRQAIRGWLQAFVQMYSDNYIIIATPPEGYGLLNEYGAVPVYLRPWNDQMIKDYAARVAGNWQALTGQESVPVPEPADENAKPIPINEYLAQILPELRSRSLHEITLYLWQRLLRPDYDPDAPDQDESADSLREHPLLLAYLTERFPDTPGILPELERMGRLQFDNGYITRSAIVDEMVAEEMIRRGLWNTDHTPRITPEHNTPGTTTQQTPADTPARTEEAFFSDEPIEEDDIDSLFASDENEANEVNEEDEEPVAAAPDAVFAESATSSPPTSEDGEPLTAEDIKKEENRLRGELNNQQKKFLNVLTEAGLLVAYRHGGYQFRHMDIAAYLAAHALEEANNETLVEKYRLPAWKPVFPHLAQVRDVSVLVSQQLSQPQDVLHQPVLELTRWLKYAGTDVEWRTPLLKYLGNLMVAPYQYSLLRERIAAALISSRDKGAQVIFRRALQERKPDIQRIACLALGAFRAEAALDALADVALQSPEKNTAIAGALAVGAIGTEEALYTLVEVLQISDDNDIRRALAESLAANREQGYMTLYDAARAEEMLLRRAAVFGLGRIDTDWALIALNETYLEDEEWYVRSAAEVVFKEIYEESLQGVRAYPEPDEAPWLHEWAEEEIERGNLPHDIEGMPLFERALDNHDDPLIRLLATVTIGQTGFYEKIDEVYQALTDNQEAIRDAAYRTLGQFQEKLGEPLPSPTA
jgi:HEAT repeat protein